MEAELGILDLDVRGEFAGQALRQIGQRIVLPPFLGLVGVQDRRVRSIEAAFERFRKVGKAWTARETAATL